MPRDQPPGHYPPRKPPACWRCGALQLSARDWDVLAGLADGLSLAQLAHRLLLSEGTVNNERDRLYKTLGVHSRQEALAVARWLGLLSPPPGAGPAPPAETR